MKSRFGRERRPERKLSMHGPSGDNSKSGLPDLSTAPFPALARLRGEDPIHCNARAEAIRQRRISTDEPEIFYRSDQAFSSVGDRTVMNDIDDDRDELAFAQLDLARYLGIPCSWSRPCAEAVRDGPTRSTPASTRWCTVRIARHRARWRSKRSNRECLAAGTR